MGSLVCILVAVLAIVGIYILARLCSKAVFRSYYEEKRRHYDRVVGKGSARTIAS